MRLAERVKNEATDRLRLSRETGELQWHLSSLEGNPVLADEPDTSWWQRALLRLLRPLVPEDRL